MLSECNDPLFNKKHLKEILVKEQGGVCCYCGKAIENNYKTTIEHILPKETYPELALDYFNLLASCHGCSQVVIHTKTNNESIESIAIQHNASVEQLRDVYIETHMDEIAEYCKSFYDFENIPNNQKVLISPILGNDLHCDSEKKNKEIDITPLDIDCYKYFDYKKKTGEIVASKTYGNKELIKLTIKRLGLNNKILKRNRLDVINATIYQFQQLKELCKNDPELIKDKTRKLISNLKQEERIEKNYKPFFFVRTKVLEGK